VTTWSGCNTKDSVVDDYDNGDHVIAAVLKLRLCVYTYAHAKCARGAMWSKDCRSWELGAEGRRRLLGGG